MYRSENRDCSRLGAGADKEADARRVIQDLSADLRYLAKRRG